ncbi:MAG TPA: hypothetical protein VIX82_15130, partial [Solirubrobacteraceae bacterium]
SLVVAACAPLAPPSGASRTPQGSARAQAAVTHEYPSPPVAQSAAGGSATPEQAVIAYASAYINWTSTTIAGDMRALAASSVDQARSVATLAAAQTASDYELQRGGIDNSGTVEAVAPLPGERSRYVVVTQELTTATNTAAYQGLAPAWHVALARVSELSPGHWVVSGWQPQS